MNGNNRQIKNKWIVHFIYHTSSYIMHSKLKTAA